MKERLVGSQNNVIHMCFDDLVIKLLQKLPPFNKNQRNFPLLKNGTHIINAGAF